MKTEKVLQVTVEVESGETLIVNLDSPDLENRRKQKLLYIRFSKLLKQMEQKNKDLESKIGYYHAELERKELALSTLRQELAQAKQLNLPGIYSSNYCQYCEKEFITRHKKQKFCSQKCKDTYYNKLKRETKKRLHDAYTM